MEEKQTIKVNLSTVLLISAFIVIGIMGFFIYKFYDDKTKANENIDKMQLQINTLNNQINNMQNSKVSKKDEIKANNDKNGNIINNYEDTEITDTEVKAIVADYLELRANADCGTPLEILVEKGKLIGYDKDKYNISTSTGVITTNIKFADYKKAMLNYVSEKEFENNWHSTQQYGENNGFFTHMQSGGGYREYKINDITKINDLIYSVNTTSQVENDTSTIENSTFEFGLKKVNEKYVIDTVKELN